MQPTDSRLCLVAFRDAVAIGSLDGHARLIASGNRSFANRPDILIFSSRSLLLSPWVWQTLNSTRILAPDVVFCVIGRNTIGVVMMMMGLVPPEGVELAMMGKGSAGWAAVVTGTLTRKGENI